jgi:hypothetical protein
LGNSSRPPFDRLGLGLQYALHGFQDDAAGDILGLNMANTSVLRDISRLFGQSYGVAEYRRPCMLAESAYISAIPKNRRIPAFHQ